MHRIKSEAGIKLNAECQLVEMQGKPSLILESWGPSARNADYNLALTTILRRLQNGGVATIRVLLASRPVMATHSESERTLRLKDNPEIILVGIDADELRKELGKAQLSIGRAAGATGGNRTKRLQIFQRAMSHEDWLRIINGECQGWNLKEAVPDVESDPERFEDQVADLLILVPSSEPPEGVNKPKRWIGGSVIFARCPAVKVWVLQQAGGKCENCGESTFLDDTGRWYLEVHHLLGLACGGSDTPGNTVALCPNCHRAFHYSENKELLRKSLIGKLSRLRYET
jgi:5-methylcytosine-specific restriction protein A